MASGATDTARGRIGEESACLPLSRIPVDLFGAVHFLHHLWHWTESRVAVGLGNAARNHGSDLLRQTDRQLSPRGNRQLELAVRDVQLRYLRARSEHVMPVQLRRRGIPFFLEMLGPGIN